MTVIAPQNIQPLTRNILHINHIDTVVVALCDLEKGDIVEYSDVTITLLQSIPKGHKIAIADISNDQHIVKYGHSIGIAVGDIKIGEHVHSHNVRTGLSSDNDYQYEPIKPIKRSYPTLRDTFMGYRRKNGKVGTRNEIWILNTVGCVNKTAENIARRAEQKIRDNPEFINIDGIHAFSHPYGCSQLGDDLNLTRSILSSLAQHPNAAGVLIVGLGCENNQLDKLLKGLDHIDHNRIRAFNAQSVFDENEAGEEAVDELLEIIKNDQRTECSVKHLSLGMKCGGSDAFSGLTANPLVGEITDIVTALGGRSTLTEVPEMFGAEQMLMNRAKNEGIFKDIIHLINDFKDYFIRHDQPIYENPSPGNVKGGITTLEEKSLGAIQKGGSAIIHQVLPYGEPCDQSGLTLITAPGNDAVSVTALTASGATIILFTTGRGTPLGFPAPTLKISTNSALKAHKPKWIDFDAGPLLCQDGDMETLAEELWNLVLDTASGKETCNELNDCREIAIWKQGVTL